MQTKLSIAIISRPTIWQNKSRVVVVDPVVMPTNILAYALCQV